MVCKAKAKENELVKHCVDGVGVPQMGWCFWNLKRTCRSCLLKMQLIP